MKENKFKIIILFYLYIILKLFSQINTIKYIINNKDLNKILF